MKASLLATPVIDNSLCGWFTSDKQEPLNL